jgi:hypothetical protein
MTTSAEHTPEPPPQVPTSRADHGIRAPGFRRWRRGVRWFAAEFLVVVTGVLVALAASDQAQRARERNLANEYTTRVIEDLDRISRSIQLVLGWSSAVEASGAVLLPVLEDEAPIADSLLLLTAAYQASRLPQPDLSAIAYRELLATGQIRLFRDGAVRQALGGYFADLERAAGFLADIPTDYSTAVRRALPISVQYGVRQRCRIGDTDLATCKPTTSAEEIRSGVSRVLGTRELASGLRHTLHAQYAIRDYMEAQDSSNQALRAMLMQGRQRRITVR